MTASDWIALAVGAALGPVGYGILHAARRWLRKTIDARVCPLCRCGCRATIPPPRTFADGVRQLNNELDRQKEN